MFSTGFTFSGHFRQQLVCELLREENRVSEAQGTIGARRAKALQVLAQVGQAKVGQGRRRRVVLGEESLEFTSLKLIFVTTHTRLIARLNNLQC